MEQTNLWRYERNIRSAGRKPPSY